MIWTSKHKYLPRWSCTHACLFTGCFYSGRLAFPVSIPHDRTRETEWKKDREKERKGGRERERQKYRERAGTLGQTDHQWPSFPRLCQWLNWSLLPGWLCVWMRCVRSQNTHRWSYFFKWMSYNHINTLDGLWLFFLPSDYCLLPTAWKHRMTTKMTEILCFVKSLPSSL